MTRSEALLAAVPVVRMLAGMSGHDYAPAVADAWGEKLRAEAEVDPGRVLDEDAEAAVSELLDYAWSTLSPDDAVDWVDLLARNIIECAGSRQPDGGACV